MDDMSVYVSDHLLNNARKTKSNGIRRLHILDYTVSECHDS